MIIIGEKINGAIPSIKQAIAERNEALIVERTLAQAKAGANFLDCAPSTATEIEYETMVWLIGLMQGCTDVPLCIDSPNAALLARILEEGHVKMEPERGDSSHRPRKTISHQKLEETQQDAPLESLEDT